MASEDVTLRVILRGNREASRGLDAVAASGRAMGKTLAYGAAAIGALGVGVAAWGIKQAASIQTATMNLTTLTGSAKTAKMMVKQLNDYANATTFDTAGVAESAQQMLTFGINTKDVLPDIKMLGDIALGNQQKLSGLAYVFSQVQGVGHLMGGDLNQMINNGFNPLQEISKKTGKSMGELRQEMSKGQISFQMVQQAMVDATAKGGRFYNGAKNGSKTLSGAWGNLTGTISSGVGMALQPLLPVIQDLLGKFSDWASKKIPALQAALKNWMTDLKNGTGTAGKLKDGLKTAWDVVSGLVGFLTSHKSEVLAFVGVIVGFTVAMAVLNAVMDANPVSLVVIAVALLAAWFVHLYKTSKTFRTGVQEMWSVLKPLGKFLGTVMIGYLKLEAKAFLFLAKWGVWGLKQLLQASFTVFGGILDAADKGLGWIPGLGGKIKAAKAGFDKFGDGVIKMLDGVGQGIDQANTALDKLGQKKASPEVVLRFRTVGAGSGSAPANKFATGLQMADGGVIKHRHGGVHVIAAEAGRDEAFVPLNGNSYMVDRSGVTKLPAAFPAVDPGAMMPSTDGMGSVLTLHNVVELDGKVIYDSVKDRARTQIARS